MRSVYLDYSATTPVKQEVIDAMVPYFTEVYGNPSSLYSQGLVVREAVLKARKQVADLIGRRRIIGSCSKWLKSLRIRENI